MASKGLRANHQSSYTEINAGEKLRKPLKPLLAIACVCLEWQIYLEIGRARR